MLQRPSISGMILNILLRDVYPSGWSDGECRFWLTPWRRLFSWRPRHRQLGTTKKIDRLVDWRLTPSPPRTSSRRWDARTVNADEIFTETTSNFESSPSPRPKNITFSFGGKTSNVRQTARGPFPSMTFPPPHGKLSMSGSKLIGKIEQDREL